MVFLFQCDYNLASYLIQLLFRTDNARLKLTSTELASKYLKSFSAQN